jgi:hypothetical protein
MQSSLVVWQARYCDSRWEQCARYVLAKSGMRVPARLLPSGHELGELPAAEGP